jgi:hypothetical protein
MYILIIDGRQSGYSDGALDWETAKWLQLLGASDGANMDGGGSSCLVMQSSTGAPIELNRDSASASDGSERTVGSQFGIYAKPLPGFINNVQALADDTAATITWETTSPSTSQVDYGLTNLDMSTPLESDLVTNHAVLLTNLAPATGYYYTVQSQAGSTLHVSSNFFFTTTNYVVMETLIGLTNSWEYTTNDLDGTNWTAADYDDSSWFGPAPGLLWTDPSGPPPGVSLLNTEMPFNSATGFPCTTYYFRASFAYTNPLLNASLQFTNYIDDGAVFYLNGAEVYRIRMPPAPTPIYNATLATNYPCDGYATCPDVFEISGDALTNLVVGDNVLAVEVHLDNPLASAITFGSMMISSVPYANPAQVGILNSNQSITVNWTRGGFLLQEASDLTGPWTNVPGPVVSPPFVLTNGASNQFFRLSR